MNWEIWYVLRWSSEMEELTYSAWYKDELPHQGKEPIIISIYRQGNKSGSNNKAYHCYQLHTTFYAALFMKGIS